MHGRDDAWQRITRHALVLLGGGTVSAIFALGTLSITARALLPVTFGALAIAQAYALLVERAGTFQSWQTLIRFGAIAREAGDDAAFRGLIRFGYHLDVAGGLVGAVGGVLIGALAGHALGWTAETRTMAIVYAASVLFRISGTSLAVLRLHDRFDQTAIARACAGLVRLVGSGIAALLHADVGTFALIWMLGDLIPSAVMFVCARRALTDARHTRATDAPLSLAAVRARYPELLGMFWTTNLHSTVKIVARDADVLVAGIIGGPAVAGVVRIARQIGSAMGQLSDPLMQAIYPEMSSAAAAHRTATVRALVVRAGLWGASAGAAIVVTLWFVAPTVLTLAAGAEYVVGAPALLAYAIAQALSLATLAVSPALLSLGRARESFIALCVATGVYVLALFPAIRAMGASGAGWALVLFQLCWGLMATRTLLRATLPKADTGVDDDVHPPQSTSSQLETRAA